VQHIAAAMARCFYAVGAPAAANRGDFMRVPTPPIMRRCRSGGVGPVEETSGRSCVRSVFFRGTATREATSADFLEAGGGSARPCVVFVLF